MFANHAKLAKWNEIKQKNSVFVFVKIHTHTRFLIFSTNKKTGFSTPASAPLLQHNQKHEWETKFAHQCRAYGVDYIDKN